MIEEKAKGIKESRAETVNGLRATDTRNSVGLALRTEYNRGKMVLEGFFDFEETYSLKKLGSGDCIGVRALLSNSIDADGKLQQEIPSGLTPAMFSIVSSSANLKVIEIDTRDMSNIPPYIRKKMRDGAMSFIDHDLIEDENLVKLEFSTWEKVKQGMTVEAIKTENSLNRKKNFWEAK